MIDVTFELPAALQAFAQARTVIVPAERSGTVADALAALSARHPGVVDRILDERGELRRHVNVFLDAENIRFIGGLRAPLTSGSTIIVVPAVSGG